MWPNSLIKSNLHTHSSFCDGEDTPEQIVRSAIDLGMETIGFSGHAYTSFDDSYCMSLERQELYRREVNRLREEYRDRIHILCGIEKDFYAEEPEHPFDYIIGSVHYVRIDGVYCEIDSRSDQVPEAVNTYCGGNVFKFVREYYRTVAALSNQVKKCDIVGHFDLISKYNEGRPLFDESDPRYLRPAFEALDALIDRGMLFELNTGAILRKCRRVPYPAPAFLKRIAERGGRITLNSDSHKKENLLGSFAEVIPLLKMVGFREVYAMTRNGWKACPI